MAFEVEPFYERAGIEAMGRFRDSKVWDTDWVLRMPIAHRTYSPLMMDALRTARTMDEGIAALWRLDGTPEVRSLVNVSSTCPIERYHRSLRLPAFEPLRWLQSRRSWRGVASETRGVVGCGG